MNIMDTLKKVNSKRWQRLMALFMVPLIIATTTTPLPVVAETERGPHPTFVPNTSSKPVKARTGPHKLTNFETKLSFSAHPNDVEITSARIFSEPLIPMSGPSVAGENEALAKALLSFKKQTDQDNISDLTKFIAAFPNSRWRPSIALNLGHRRFDTGYLTEAMSYWSFAWQTAKEDPGLLQKRVADAAMAELVGVNSRVGRADELEKLLAQLKGRHLLGSDEEKVHCAIEALGKMKRFPEKAFRCGPCAVESILNIGKTAVKVNPAIENLKSTTAGTNLLEVKELADKVGLHYQMAKRSAGAPVLVPSIVHWNLSHFGAIVGKIRGRYLIKDPTFGPIDTMSVSAQALDAESDGYALVPAGPLPAGWQAVTEEEAQSVWGRGVVSAIDYGEHGASNGSCGGSGGSGLYTTYRNFPGGGADAGSSGSSCSSCSGPFSDPLHCSVPPASTGMAKASYWPMQAILHISDSLMSYAATEGPGVCETINNNYLEANQPAVYTFPTLGPNWSFNWMSYLTVDSGTSTATVRIRGGGSEIYPLSGGVYTNDLISQALLVNMGSGTYQRQLPDGSTEVFNLADTASPPHIFMTEVIDPQGNSALIQYDANFRITTITDAINQISTGLKYAKGWIFLFPT